MNSMSRPAYFALVALFVLTWSSAFPATKFAIAASPPLLFLGIRFLIAAALLLGWAAARGELRGRVPYGTLAALGVLNWAGYNGSTWTGMATISSGLSTVICSMSPVLVAAAAVPVLGEKLGIRRALGLVLGIAGVVFLVRNRIAFDGEDVGGVIWTVIGLVSMVAATLAFKRLSPVAPLSVVVGVQQAAAGLFLLAIGLATENVAAVRIDTAAFWAVMGWTVGIVSIGAFSLWFVLLRRGSASDATALHFLMPPTGLAMGWLVLGETVSWLDMLAVIPIAISIRMVTR